MAHVRGQCSLKIYDGTRLTLPRPQNFNYFNETMKGYAELLWRPMLSTPVELSICSTTCLPHQPPLLSKTFIKYPPPAPGVDKLQLPPCSGAQPVRGGYLPSNRHDTIYPPFALPQHGYRFVAGHYDFVPEGCAWNHAGLRFRDHEPCTRQPRRVLVMGDSHGRVAYDSMVHRLSGQQTINLDSVRQVVLATLVWLM